MAVLKNKKDKTITLILDEKELKQYLDFYFYKNKGRKKIPIENPVHPSINQWAGQHYHKKNALKKDWHDFINWYIKKYGLHEYKIKKCKMTCVLTYPTKHRRDPDNYTHKFINDGLVLSGFLVDDSFSNIEEVTYRHKYEKDVYKTEIIIEIIDMEGEFI